MALDTEQLKDDLLELYSELNTYDNSEGKSAEDAMEHLAQEMANIMRRFVRTGKINDDGYVR